MIIRCLFHHCQYAYESFAMQEDHIEDLQMFIQRTYSDNSDQREKSHIRIPALNADLL